MLVMKIRSNLETRYLNRAWPTTWGGERELLFSCVPYTTKLFIEPKSKYVQIAKAGELTPGRSYHTHNRVSVRRSNSSGDRRILSRLKTEAQAGIWTERFLRPQKRGSQGKITGVFE